MLAIIGGIALKTREQLGVFVIVGIHLRRLARVGERRGAVAKAYIRARREIKPFGGAVAQLLEQIERLLIMAGIYIVARGAQLGRGRGIAAAGAIAAIAAKTAKAEAAKIVIAAIALVIAALGLAAGIICAAAALDLSASA